jgi:hypothetical protein
MMGVADPICSVDARVVWVSATGSEGHRNR